ncbi:PNGase F N-terminal domain-containing protein [Niabella aquatica]
MNSTRFFLLFVVLGNWLNAAAQIPFTKDADTYRIAYTAASNGKTRAGENKILVFANNKQTIVTTEKDFKNEGTLPSELFIADHKTLYQILYAFLKDSKVISATDSTSVKKQQFEFLDEQKKILGYECRKAKTVVNSNTIELWYTTALNVKGAPTILGQDLGLVLQMVRNGNFSLTADAVRKVNFEMPHHWAVAQPAVLDLLSYRDEIWQSRFTTIPLFTDQIVHFSDSAAATPGIMRFANGTVVVKKVQFPEFGKGKSIFLDLKEQSNGDAYDRTGTVFLIPAGKEISFLHGLKNGANTLPVYENGNGKKYQGVVVGNNYDPPVELMRFFTPFGVKQFNYLRLKGKEWEDAVYYRQDISAYSPLLDGKDVYIGVFIGNYDKGGHKITANITLHEDDSQAPGKVVPLFNTLNIMEMAGQEYATMFDNDKGLVADFELKEPVNNAVLRYTTTGHGGWGNGDEFVPKQNTILLDGKEVWGMVPWREDCGSYRLYNPASGNFSTGLSSSDLSRSNWCPGTVTNPYIISLGNLSAGKHTIQVKIPQGKPEGSSFSAWNVSGVLVGD